MIEAMTNPLVTALKRNSLDDGPGIRTTVFFKGCPLSCVWCQNPEAKSSAQQIVYEAANCIGCLRCTQACGNHAICIQPDGAYPVDRQKCQLCGECVRACGCQALRLAGTAYDVDQLVQKCLQDAVFYKNTNGGVTFSGGEPTLHLKYLSCLAQKLKEKEIHLCLETCGHYDNEQFEQELLPYLDLVYFDIKIFDRDKHKKYCGVYNDTILRNFETLFSGKKVKVLPRIPLVPGITAEKDNLLSIRGFLKNCGVEEIGLLPYNPLWLSKLSSIGAVPPAEPERRGSPPEAEYNHTEWMKGAEKDEIKEIFRDFSFRNF